MSTTFSTDISGIVGGLKLTHASHRLFEAWQVSDWLKVGFLGDIKVFFASS